MRMDELLEEIQANPGLTYEELSNKLNIPTYSLHLKCNKLVKQKYIIIKKMGRVGQIYPLLK